MPADRPFLLLVHLLRLALRPDVEVALPAGASFTADDWLDAYNLAGKHAVMAIAWDGVERLQTIPNGQIILQTLPASLMGKWFADSRTIVAANARMEQQAEQVRHLLREAGYDSLVLKGQTLSAFYPLPQHRQAADIDLWVLPSVTGQSLAGHRKTLLAVMHDLHIPVGEVVYHHAETRFFPQTEVELHFTPTWLCHPQHNSRLQQIFMHGVSRQADAGPAMQPAVLELYVLLHAFRHIYHDGLALRHLADYWLVRTANRTAGIPVPADWYGIMGLAAFAAAIDELTDLLFGSMPLSDDNLSLKTLSSRARHLLQVLPERRISCRVKWDYPSETLWALPWRTAHLIWRKYNKFV